MQKQQPIEEIISRLQGEVSLLKPISKDTNNSYKQAAKVLCELGERLQQQK